MAKVSKFAPADRRAPLLLVLLAAIAFLQLSSLSLVAVPVARAARICHAPRLSGLTLSVARLRSKHAGCALRLKGAKLEQVRVQTVLRQSPAAGRRSSSVTVWLNPFCNGSAAYGPDIQEPTVSAGPTELISGFYLRGGPLKLYSTPRCKRPEPEAGAGTVEVMDATGSLVASASSTQGQLVTVALPAGSYTIRGTFLDSELNGTHPIGTESLVIPAGHTVRQDFFLDVP